MAAFDPSPSGKQAAALVGDGGKTLLPLANAAAQALVAALWSLPATASAHADGGAGAAPVAPVPGRVVDLPKPSTWLPRAKPPPEPRAPTRWEAFAARKGIDKKGKRSKLVFDEDEGEWKRRHGYKRARDDNDIPIVDAKPGDGPGFDPFGEATEARKERVKTNRAQQLGNIKASAKVLANSPSSLALPPTLALASSLPKHGAKGPPAKGGAARATLKSAARQAGVSTASMGKHDVLGKGEGREERARALAGARRSFAPLTGRGAGDSSRDAAVVDRILRATADDVDVPLAVSRLEQERRATVRAAREVGGGGEKEDWRAKGRKGGRRSKAGRPPGMHGALPAAAKKKGKGGAGGGGAAGKAGGRATGGKAKGKR